MMAFALNVVSQTILKTLTNGAFISKTGEIFEETPDDNPCAGQEVFLVLEFKKSKVNITEKFISSCGNESIGYKLEYKWELTNHNEIKIFYKPEEVKYKLIDNMKLIIIGDVIRGCKNNLSGKEVEYVFHKPLMKK